MGHRPFLWFRPFSRSNREKRAQSSQLSQPSQPPRFSTTSDTSQTGTPSSPQQTSSSSIKNPFSARRQSDNRSIPRHNSAQLTPIQPTSALPNDQPALHVSSTSNGRPVVQSSRQSLGDSSLPPPYASVPSAPRSSIQSQERDQSSYHSARSQPQPPPNPSPSTPPPPPPPAKQSRRRTRRSKTPLLPFVNHRASSIVDARKSSSSVASPSSSTHSSRHLVRPVPRRAPPSTFSASPPSSRDRDAFIPVANDDQSRALSLDYSAAAEAPPARRSDSYQESVSLRTPLFRKNTQPPSGQHSNPLNNSQVTIHSVQSGSTPSVDIQPSSLDHFIPHRPTDRRHTPASPLSHSSRARQQRVRTGTASSSFVPSSSSSSSQGPSAPPSTQSLPPPPPTPPSLTASTAPNLHLRTSALTPEVPSVDRLSPPIYANYQQGYQTASRLSVGQATDGSRDENHEPSNQTKYNRVFRGGNGRFAFRTPGRSKRSKRGSGPPLHAVPSAGPSDEAIFGTTQHDDPNRSSDIRAGEEILIRFIRKTLGPVGENLAVRLMNKTPITSMGSFAYVIHQGSEESDIDIIRRDLTSGRLFASGMRLLGGAWCNLLLGDRFAPGCSSRQRHEMTYRRSSCSCLVCMVRAAEMLRMSLEETSAMHRGHSEFSDSESNQTSADILSNMSSAARTPLHSAMANFVVVYKLPSTASLMTIGASTSGKELEIGSVIRLNYRASAKLKFTDDVKELFGHLAYTGPISHEEVYRRVTTIGVHYYLYNKGKKERKVYIQGELIRLPINVGVVKLGTQPMYMSELGATFCLYRKQIMSIYVGEIVLEGNSIGSFIKTGIRYYIGFGEERGVCPVYPNKMVGKARKLGVNELLLHHHMVEDLEVKCL